MVEFSILKELQKELIIQKFESAIQGLIDIVEFCECLATSEEIFQTQGERNHQNKKPISPVNSNNPLSRRRAKGQTRPQTPGKRTLTNRKEKKENSIL